VLSRRLLSAAVIISVMLGIVWADYHLVNQLPMFGPGLLLCLITSVGVIWAAGELVQMWRLSGRAASLPVALFGTSLLAIGAAAPALWPRPLGECPLGFFGGTFLGFFVATGLAAVYEIANFGQQPKVADRLINHVFIFAYLALLVGSVPHHRRLLEDNGFGLCAVIAVITTVKMSDAAAYFFGRSFGRRKLAPKISSGKTIEGALGAFVGGILGAAIVFRLVVPQVSGIDHLQSWTWIVAYGIFISLAGMVGDLFESIIKRDAGLKDSSVWLPGLGGIMDVMDSLIFAAPASSLFWILFENL
jgi:phosphatidate cytidylyltransferase